MSPAQEIYAKEFDAIFFKLSSKTQQQVDDKISELGRKLRQFPHHRLKGSINYRFRVGDYRVLYQFDLNKNILYLVTLGHRREIYKNL